MYLGDGAGGWGWGDLGDMQGDIFCGIYGADY